eukprot:COSAG01_NODE_7998_length_2958_cov_3.415530_1_plen_185_part_00
MASHPSQHQPSLCTSKSAPYLLRTHPRGCLQLARKLGVLTPRPRQPRRRVGSCLPRLPNRWLGIRAGSPRHSVCRPPHGDGHVGRAPSGARPLPPSDLAGWWDHHFLKCHMHVSSADACCCCRCMILLAGPIVGCRQNSDSRPPRPCHPGACMCMQGLPAPKFNVPLGRRTMGGGGDVPHSPAT